MKQNPKLKSCLDALAAEYGPEYLDSDPLGMVHDYRQPLDIEIAGFIAAVLAYGGAGQIRKSVRTALLVAGKSPFEFVSRLTVPDALEVFGNFRHRWTDGGDMAFVFWALGRAVREFGSPGALVKSLDDDGPTIEGILTRLSQWFKDQYDSRFALSTSNRGFSYLVPSPAKGSACKRLAMYFRWMVRGPDEVDFGLWDFISPARLVIPVDRHIARMGQLLNLTSRKAPDWKMAIEISNSLKELDPDDPIRYDFALVRPGILGECTTQSKGDCLSCLLKTVCREAG